MCRLGGGKEVFKLCAKKKKVPKKQSDNFTPRLSPFFIPVANKYIQKIQSRTWGDNP
jgi:hypothetical protein